MNDFDFLSFSLNEKKENVFNLLFNYKIFNRKEGLLITAINNNYEDIFKLIYLEDSVDPANHENSLLCLAARKNKTKIVELLFNDKRIDLTAQKSFPLIMAYKNKNKKLINLLFGQKNVRDSLKLDDKEIYKKITKEQLLFKMKRF